MNTIIIVENWKWLISMTYEWVNRRFEIRMETVKHVISLQAERNHAWIFFKFIFLKILICHISKYVFVASSSIECVCDAATSTVFLYLNTKYTPWQSMFSTFSFLFLFFQLHLRHWMHILNQNTTESTDELITLHFIYLYLSSF